MNPRGAQLEAQPRPAEDLAIDAAFTQSTLGTTVDGLLRDLRGSPTDLAKLVTSVQRRRCNVVAISPKAIARWSEADPDSWKRVRDWLSMRGVRIVET